MAAAAAPADMAAEARRAVIRSEKFMEWQRELSSTRAAYGGRKRCDDTEAAASNAALKKHPRKSDEGDAKGSKGLGPERDAKAQHPMIVSHAETSAVNAKVKEQQQQRQRSDSKKPEKGLISGSKKIVANKGKDASEQVDAANSRLRKCKQSGTQAVHSRSLQHNELSQPTCSTQPASRRRRQMPSADQELLSSKRIACGEAVAPVDLPSNRGSKRSRRAARRLANEEPHRPPLKLPKLNLVLSRKEIHEDWFKITGQKYSGKPRKSMLFQLGLGLCTSLTCPSTIRYLNDPQ